MRWRSMDWKEIAHELADDAQVSFCEMTGGQRFKRFVHPRQKLCWILVKIKGMSLSEAGRLIGGRDHTTVLHGVRKYQERLDAGVVTHD